MQSMTWERSVARSDELFVYPPRKLKMLDRAVDEGNSVLEKRARRAVLRRQAKERVDVRQRAAKVLKEQRRRESTAGAR